MRLTLGYSGGALLNLDGELIGLTTSQAALVGSESPGGFAIPIDDGMKRIIEVLRRGEKWNTAFSACKSIENRGRARACGYNSPPMARRPSERTESR